MQASHCLKSIVPPSECIIAANFKEAQARAFSPRKGSTTPASSNTNEAETLPANTCTALCTATVVSGSVSSTGSVPYNTDGSSLADALTASVPSTSSSTAAARAPPFPLEHYEVTRTQMQAADSPLPAVSERSQQVLPSGFVAANKTAWAIPVLCGASSFVYSGQDMLCCIALGCIKQFECS